jgi:hypothetical protein
MPGLEEGKNREFLLNAMAFNLKKAAAMVQGDTTFPKKETV